MRSPRGPTTAIAVAILILAGCTSDDEWPEGLTDIRDTDPPEADADDREPDETDQGDADDADNDGASDDPDQDAAEPDTSDDPDEGGEQGEGVGEGITVSGVFVPDDAFQINDEIDLDEETQLEYLQFVLDAYLYTTQAANTGEWDDAQLAAYYSGGAFESTTDSLRRYEEEGLRQHNDGTVVEFLRMAAFDGGGIVVHQCTRRGSEDGLIEIETGEYTFRSERTHRLVETPLALVELDDGTLDYRIVGGAVNDAVPCP